MCCGGAEAEGAPSEAQLSSNIDKALKTEEKKLNSVVKLLLLGRSPPSLAIPLKIPLTSCLQAPEAVENLPFCGYLHCSGVTAS
jgi:hypothetical protein